MGILCAWLFVSPVVCIAIKKNLKYFLLAMVPVVSCTMVVGWRKAAKGNSEDNLEADEIKIWSCSSNGSRERLLVSAKFSKKQMKFNDSMIFIQHFCQLFYKIDFNN